MKSAFYYTKLVQKYCQGGDIQASQRSPSGQAKKRNEKNPGFWAIAHLIISFPYPA